MTEFHTFAAFERGAGMEDTTARSYSIWNDFRWLMWTLMVIVSITALLQIFSAWHSYHFVKRFGAIALALLLLGFPVSLILSFRKGKTVQTEQGVVFAYLMLMMSTMLAER